MIRIFKRALLKEICIALLLTAIIVLCFLFTSGTESRFIYTDF